MPDSSSQRARVAERRREALAPGQLVAQVVGLVGDDERAGRALARPARPRPPRPRVGDRDAVEVARRAQLGRVGHELQAQRGRRPPPTGGSAAWSGRRRRRGATCRSRSSWRASSSDGRVLPAPGAARDQERPDVHARIASSAAHLPRPQSACAAQGSRAALHAAAQDCATAPDGIARMPLASLSRDDVRGVSNEGVGLDLDQHPRVDEARSPRPSR